MGAIPIKSNKGDPITWLPAADMKLKDMVTQPQPKVLVPVTLRLQQGKGLGCIICKGPAEFPGIFVQKVKSQGLALEAGLEPGDQIVECNGLPLTHQVSFQESVVQLKSHPKLDLIVRKGVGKAFIADKLASEALSDTSSSHNPAAASKTAAAYSVKKQSANIISSPAISHQSPYSQGSTRLQTVSSDELEAERLNLERSKIALERKKLEAEVERLRRETEQLERHQQQLRNSCQQQQQQLSDTSS